MLWRWSERRLVVLAVLAAMVDFLSTYAALELSGNCFVGEAGWLAVRALDAGGFGLLLLVDIAAVGALTIAAMGTRMVFLKWGFSGYARAGFVILLLPYTLMAAIAAVNNVVLALI